MTPTSYPIRKLAKANTDFCREVITGSHEQVVLMCLQPDEDSSEEVHPDTDQLFQVIKGKGEAVLEGKSQPLGKGAMLLVPAGMRHNVRNTGHKRLRLETIYAPPHHPLGAVPSTRADAMSAERVGAY